MGADDIFILFIVGISIGMVAVFAVRSRRHQRADAAGASQGEGAEARASTERGRE